MNLVEQAEADLSFTLEDVDNGFGVALQFRDSSKVIQTVNCQSTDIGYLIDPETGQAVIGRTAEAVGRITSFNSLNIPVPTKNTSLNFVTGGVTYTAKVQENFIDRKLGLYKMTLEALKTDG